MREMDRTEEIAATAQFFDRAIRDIARPQGTGLVRVLDFGCGSGELVERLLALGYDAHGCDVVPAPDARAPPRNATGGSSSRLTGCRSTTARSTWC